MKNQESNSVELVSYTSQAYLDIQSAITVLKADIQDDKKYIDLATERVAQAKLELGRCLLALSPWETKREVLNIEAIKEQPPENKVLEVMTSSAVLEDTEPDTRPVKKQYTTEFRDYVMELLKQSEYQTRSMKMSIAELTVHLRCGHLKHLFGNATEKSVTDRVRLLVKNGLVGMKKGFIWPINDQNPEAAPTPAEAAKPWEKKKERKVYNLMKNYAQH